MTVAVNVVDEEHYRFLNCKHLHFLGKFEACS